jgi:two-component system, NtrC family, sensor histidine kinase PilS
LALQLSATKRTSEIDTGLKNSIALRVIVATVLLSAGAIIYFENNARNEAFFLAFIMVLVYLLSLVYSLLYPIFKDSSNWFVAAQVALDLVLASAVIYITGGKSSPFIFLYPLIIIFADTVLTRIAGYVTALASGILYVLIVFYQFHLEFHSSLRLLPILWGEKGFAYTFFNLAGFLLIAMLSGYLSEKIRETGKQLRESSENLSILKNLYENIVQSLASGIITLDLKWKIISVNKTALEILGIMGQEGKDEIVGANFGYLMPGLRVEELLSKKREEILYSSNGKELVLGFSSSTLRDGNEEVIGHIIIFQDLTEVKKLEERLRLSEKMALLGQLSAGLAHEVRNPLSIISGSIEVLSNDVKPSDENVRLLKVAIQEVERLNLLVEDFLLLTSPIQSLTSSVDICRIIGETVELFLNGASRNGFDVIVNTQKELYVRADFPQLKQVFWNLLLNAREAMPNGGKIMVETHADKNDVVVKVSDEGCGIDEKTISRIFEPFFTTKKVGTGLGLAIVQKVVEGYNGRICVVSAENKGATFIITLPKVEKLEELVRNS